jgi:hypothetical protein
VGQNQLEEQTHIHHKLCADLQEPAWLRRHTDPCLWERDGGGVVSSFCPEKVQDALRRGAQEPASYKILLSLYVMKSCDPGGDYKRH